MCSNVETKRSANFTTEEVENLLKLVNEKKDVIECKKTDRTTAAEKMDCWVKVQDDFNAQFGGYRSHKTLKIKYDNLKKNAKKNYALDKKERYKTGGGPKPQSNLSSIDEDIIEMLQTEQIEGLPSTYDDDKIEKDLPKTNLDENVQYFDEKSAESSFLQESPKHKWDKYTPKMLRASKHPALATENKKTTKDVWADVALMKLKKCELEMKLLEEEAKLKKIKLELEIEELQHKVGKCTKCDPMSIKLYPKEF